MECECRAGISGTGLIEENAYGKKDDDFFIYIYRAGVDSAGAE